MTIRKNGTVLSVEGNVLKFYRLGRPSSVPPLVVDIIGTHPENVLWYIDCSECQDKLTFFSINPYPHVWVTSSEAIGFQRVFKVPSEWAEGSVYVCDLKYAEDGVKLCTSEGILISTDGKFEFTAGKMVVEDVHKVIGYALYGSLQVPVWVEEVPVEEEPAPEEEVEESALEAPVETPEVPQLKEISVNDLDAEESVTFIVPAPKEETPEEPEHEEQEEPAPEPVSEAESAPQPKEPEPIVVEHKEPVVEPKERVVEKVEPVVVDVIPPDDAPMVARRNPRNDGIKAAPELPEVEPEPEHQRFEYARPLVTPEPSISLRPEVKKTNTEEIEWGGIKMLVFKTYVADTSELLSHPNIDIYRFDKSLASNVILSYLNRGYAPGFHASGKYLISMAVLGPMEGNRRAITQRYPDQRPRTIPRYLAGTNVTM